MHDHKTAGPHHSDMLNKLDPRVDSDPRSHIEHNRYGSNDSGRQTGGFVGGPHERLENRGSIPTAGGLPVGADGHGPYNDSRSGLTGSHNRDHSHGTSGLTGSHNRDPYESSHGTSGLTGSHGGLTGSHAHNSSSSDRFGSSSGNHNALSDIEYKERELALRQKELDLKEREYRINAGH
jgi:hypothetical protein